MCYIIIYCNIFNVSQFKQVSLVFHHYLSNYCNTTIVLFIFIPLFIFNSLVEDNLGFNIPLVKEKTEMG